MTTLRPVAIACVALGAAFFAGAVPAPPSSAPANALKNETGLTATLIAGKDTYNLNATQSGKQFRDQLESAKKSRQRLPAPPTVDLTLRLANPTDKSITISLGGDESRINLLLEGPGALTTENLVPMTMDFRAGRHTTIEPGKTLDIAITSLSAGQRNVSEVSYWTEPGPYSLAAVLTLTQGDKQQKIASAPIKITVKGNN